MDGMDLSIESGDGPSAKKRSGRFRRHKDSRLYLVLFQDAPDLILPFGTLASAVFSACVLVILA